MRSEDVEADEEDAEQKEADKGSLDGPSEGEGRFIIDGQVGTSSDESAMSRVSVRL